MRRIFPALLGALLLLPVLGAAALPETEAVDAGADYIISTQQDDGGFGGFGPGQTTDAIYALRAAGIDPATVESGAGATPADFLAANAPDVADASAAAKAALAAIAMDIDPRDVAGVDLIAIINADYDEAAGRYAESDFSHALIVIALAVAGEEVSEAALTTLQESQVDDGGWGFEGASDADTTAIVLQALLAGGIDAGDDSVTAALEYLGATQNADGGWGYDGASNASSTGFAVQALLAAGEDPEGETYTIDGSTPVTYLLSQQQDDGSFAGFDPAFATNQVLPALAGRTFANAPVTPLQEQPTETPTAEPTEEPTEAPTTAPTEEPTEEPTGAPTQEPTTAPTATPTRVPPSPPDTGSGTTGATGSGPSAAIIGLGALTLLLGAGLLTGATRNRRRS